MKVLLIEDEKSLADSVINYLHTSEVQCEYAANKAEALDKIAVYEYDCILLDIMLPDGNGFEILQEIKRQNKQDGVILVSAKDGVETRIEGLNLGADDYLTKPFNLSELLARVQAVIRRNQFGGNNKLQFNEIEIDINAKSVTISKVATEVTRKEYELLLYLVANKNKVLSKSAIAEHLSGDMADSLDNFDFIYAHIKNLKKKLGTAGEYINTVYGMGYKWHD